MWKVIMQFIQEFKFRVLHQDSAQCCCILKLIDCYYEWRHRLLQDGGRVIVSGAVEYGIYTYQWFETLWESAHDYNSIWFICSSSHLRYFIWIMYIYIEMLIDIAFITE